MIIINYAENNLSARMIIWKLWIKIDDIKMDINIELKLTAWSGYQTIWLKTWPGFVNICYFLFLLIPQFVSVHKLIFLSPKWNSNSIELGNNKSPAVIGIINILNLFDTAGETKR